MPDDQTYDAAVIGGGLAGLASSILLARQGFRVVLFEKEQYPFHKVCGEYVSMESWNFLESLGLPLHQMPLPRITELMLTSTDGKAHRTPLAQGGFGISRYHLDHALSRIAKEEGVEVYEGCKVLSAEHSNHYEITFRMDGKEEQITAVACLAAFGKNSNLDHKWNREFLQSKETRLNNYVGIKYHINTQWEEHLIGLHNFENGYCGISAIEDGKFCFCYLTRASNLKKHGNDITAMEGSVLGQNPFLRKILMNRTVEKDFPVAISQISFQAKSLTENGILMLGDAAGMITPLCGNGMSIALHSAKIAAGLTIEFLEGRITIGEMESLYRSTWKRNFEARLSRGRMIQKFFGSNRVSNLFVLVFRTMPFLSSPVVKLTHGKPF